MKNALFSLGILLTIAFALSAQTSRPVSNVMTGLINLYARDPLAQSLCFEDGNVGLIFQQSEVRNSCSDLNFNSYKKDAFSVGIEGGREAVIIDLGLADDLQKRYGYQDTVTRGQGFASIRRIDGKMVILKDMRAKTTQELAEAQTLFQKPSSDTESLPVKLGHIYLLRITDRHDSKFERLVKILVVAHDPNESVTVRWHVL